LEVPRQDDGLAAAAIALASVRIAMYV